MDLIDTLIHWIGDISPIVTVVLGLLSFSLSMRSRLRGGKITLRLIEYLTNREITRKGGRNGDDSY